MKKLSHARASSDHTLRLNWKSVTLLAIILTAMLTPNIAMAADSETSGKASQSQDELDTSVLGKRLSEKFLGLLKAGDTAGLEKFLSPAFQLQRATGTGATKTDYLRDLPTIGEFVVSDVVATRSGDILVVRYLATVEGLADGRMYTPGPAPRISTFVRSNGRWQIVSHANFNALLTPRHLLKPIH